MLYDGERTKPTPEQIKAGEEWYDSVRWDGELMFHVAQRLGISSAEVSGRRSGRLPLPGVDLHDYLKEKADAGVSK